VRSAIVRPREARIAAFRRSKTRVRTTEISASRRGAGRKRIALADWRTGSILWSGLGHVYVLTLMELAVGGAVL
jgi:hypothetical protein